MIECPIYGVVIRRLLRHQDARGWLMELFRDDELPAETRPAMAYVSSLLPDACRGPHEHRLQSDYFVLLGPSTVRLYLWDNRPGSRSYRMFWETVCSGDEPLAVIVPPGVVHAYRNEGPSETLVFNAPNRLYGGEKRTTPVDEIRHEEDPHSPFKIP